MICNVVDNRGNLISVTKALGRFLALVAMTCVAALQLWASYRLLSLFTDASSAVMRVESGMLFYFQAGCVVTATACVWLSVEALRVIGLRQFWRYRWMNRAVGVYIICWAIAAHIASGLPLLIIVVLFVLLTLGAVCSVDSAVRSVDAGAGERYDTE